MRTLTTKRLILICVGLFLLSQILFLVNIQFPSGHNFDEFHYVPSAKQFLEMRENQNWEHPPLGKELMAVGIASGATSRSAGGHEHGFGTFTLIGMFFWALLLFDDLGIALWVALLTLVNSLLYVQARIGMLDTFMFGFIVWGLGDSRRFGAGSLPRANAAAGSRSRASASGSRPRASGSRSFPGRRASGS